LDENKTTQLQKIYVGTDKISHDAMSLWVLKTTGIILKNTNIYSIIAYNIYKYDIKIIIFSIHREEESYNNS